MVGATIVVMVLLLGTAYGTWDKYSSGRLKRNLGNKFTLGINDIKSELGKKATTVQFSSTFCAPCRGTRIILSSVVDKYRDVKYVEINVESNLELVRKFDIRSTPTTIFLDSVGREITRAVGMPKKEEVFAALDEITRSRNE